ncbi:MAG: hypothetical protein Q7R33_05265 [Nitrosarchaeum sp.]|nr:hypothetical protein [Nitrosarchaeum sp.]
MSVVHDTATKNLIANTVCALLNGGATLIFMTTDDTVIGTINFEVTAFGSAVLGESTAASFPKQATTVAAGDITKFVIKDATLTTKISGTVTVTGGGGDIELSSITYAIAEVIQLQQLKYRVPN